MDYVVFGIGFGATILVLGLLLRDFGPRARFRRARDGSDLLSAEELVGKVRWSRFCTALGSVLALAGAVFLLITLVSMVLVVSDDTGLWVMSIAFGLLMVLIAFWTWAYFDRFGSYGILPERVEAEPEPVRRPETTREPVVAGPPVPPADPDDADDVSAGAEPSREDEGAEDVAVEAPAEVAADPSTAVEEIEREAGVAEAEAAGADITAARAVGEDSDEIEAPEEAGEAEPRLETPEERLAHTESPIDHGSAEGDLDLAASGPRRPGSLAQKRAEDDTAHPADAPTDDTSDAAPKGDRDRA